MERKETFNILKQYYKNNSYINLLLKSKKHDANVMSKITLRVYGILQNREYIDYLIYKLIEKDKIDLSIRIVMQIAVYDYIFLNKPIHACVNEAVNLTKEVAKSASGYVNHKLHRLEILDNTEINFIKEEKNLEIKYSHPRWIVKLLMKQYPDDYEKILRSNTQKKNLTVRKINSFVEPEKFDRLDIPQTSAQMYEYNDKSIVSSMDFKHDNIVIQDIGSFLVGVLVNAKSDEVVLDLCAAPGNKAMHISSSAKMVVANEINKKRFELLNANIQKYNINNIKTINCDALNFYDIEKALKAQKLPLQYDKILVDAPCSGLGVIRSKPEIKYSMNSEEINKLIDVQKGILNNASKLLKPHGKLIYSTCTINKDENENQIMEFMKANQNYKELKNEELEKYTANDSQLGMTLKPYVLNSDGFYIAKLEKYE